MDLRVAVIGAGVLGASIAGNLARLGHTVTLIEATRVGAGTTATSFAWINANQKTPRDYFELNMAGMAAHRQALGEGRAAPWLHLTGHLQWAAGQAGQAALDAKDERLRAWGYAVERLRPADVRELEPDLLLDDVDEVSYYREEGYLMPRLYLAYLVRVCQDLGVRLRTGSAVVGFDGAGGRLRSARMASGDVVAADVFVWCCGRWTPEVAGRAGVSIPLMLAETGSPAVGLLAVTAPGATRLRRVVSSPQLNLRPDRGGRILLQALDLDRTVRPEAPPGIDSPHGAEVLRRAERLLRQFVGAHIESLCVGVRALPVDGRSVVGWAPGVEGLYVVVTHSGITLAPVLGELAAREVGGDVDEPLLRRFRPSRFTSDALIRAGGSGLIPGNRTS